MASGGSFEGGAAPKAPKRERKSTWTDDQVGSIDKNVSRDALQERYAALLNRRFLKERELDDEAKQKQLGELSQQKYDEYMQRFKDSEEAKKKLDEMTRETELWIFQNMKEQTQRKLEEQEKTKSEQLEREKWRYARQLYEQLQAEARQNKLQEFEQKRKEQFKEKETKVNEAYQSAIAERDQKVAKQAEERQKLAERAAKAREASFKQKRQDRVSKLQAQEQRQKEAEEGRQKEEEERRRKSETRREEHERRVADCKQAREKFELSLIEKREKLREKPQGQGQERDVTPRQPQQDTNRQVAPAPEPVSPTKDSPAKGHVQSSQLPDDDRNTFLQESTAQKEYIRKCADLRQEFENMHINNKFKTRADAAKGSTTPAVPLDRVKKIYTSRTSKNPREQASTSTVLSTSSTKNTPRVSQCGLCQQELPHEILTGKAFKQKLEDFRQIRMSENATPRSHAHKSKHNAALSRTGRQIAVNPTGKGQDSPPTTCGPPGSRPQLSPPATTSAPPGSSSSASQQASSEMPFEKHGAALYDYEVPLCTKCNLEYTSYKLSNSRV